MTTNTEHDLSTLYFDTQPPSKWSVRHFHSTIKAKSRWNWSIAQSQTAFVDELRRIVSKNGPYEHATGEMRDVAAKLTKPATTKKRNTRGNSVKEKQMGKEQVCNIIASKGDCASSFRVGYAIDLAVGDALQEGHALHRLGWSMPSA